MRLVAVMRGLYGERSKHARMLPSLALPSSLSGCDAEGRETGGIYNVCTQRHYQAPKPYRPALCSLSLPAETRRIDELGVFG